MTHFSQSSGTAPQFEYYSRLAILIDRLIASALLFSLLPESVGCGAVLSTVDIKLSSVMAPSTGK